jgi:uncharacterized protein
MTPLDIIFDHYDEGSALADALIRHSEQVRDMALTLAGNVPHLHPDLGFIAEAALLHDIGIYRTAAAKIGCHGRDPYICHGVIGREILEAYGWTDHALVCERHVGVGITVEDIQTQGLPLPERDMVPTTIEEIIICYADEFFSKTNGGREHSLYQVIDSLTRYGQDKVVRFKSWQELLDPMVA